MTCAQCGAKTDGRPHQCAQPTQFIRARGPQHATRILPLDVGDQLDGGWRVESRIGQGAMGRVYRARNPSNGRIAAVKILNPESCRDPDLVARFEREAQLLATLRHPNIVDLFDVGRRGALPYLVMAFVSGRPLDKYVASRGGHLYGTELLDLGQQICSGLSFMHAQGLVHRDIKPGNVMVDDHGHVTILDLGVARDLREPLFTQPGMTIGTPYYMAPEQIQGPSVDHRADIYALGALLFEVVTGQLPFGGNDEHDVMRQHIHTAPPDATERDPSIPRRLSRILQRAMAKAPNDRYPNAEEMRLDLVEALAGDRTVFAAAPVDGLRSSMSKMATDVRSADTLREPAPNLEAMPTTPPSSRRNKK